MTTATTTAHAREAIREYELTHNALLRALLPGGVLHRVVVRGPVEALLVPRQVSLIANDLAEVLSVKDDDNDSDGGRHDDTSMLQPLPAMPPPLLQLHEQEHNNSNSNNNDNNNNDDGSVVPHGRYAAALTRGVLAAAQRRGLTAALQRFLSYHLVHFDSTGNSRFTTAAGQRGEFAEALDSVKRYGRLGSVAVIADASALHSDEHATRDTTTTTTTGAGAQTAVVGAYHPLRLHLFFVDQPLMDRQELQHLHTAIDDALAAVKRTGATTTTTSSAVVPAANAVSGSASGGQALPYACSAPSGLLRRSIAAMTSTQPTHAVGTTTTTLPPQHNNSNTAAAAAATDAEAEGGGGGVDSESDDVIVDEDLTPYVTKTQHQRERHLHKHVLTHEYSHESIKNYRSVVAADNDVHYDEFERLMERPACATLVRLVSHFVVRAQGRRGNNSNHRCSSSGGSDDVASSSSSSLPPLAQAMARLMSRCEDEMRRLTIHDQRERKLRILAEGIEKYVTNKLYSKLFNVDDDDARIDARLQAKLQRLEALAASQLDALDEVEYKYMWGQAMFELDGMNFFKTPREKLRCGMRACELLSLAVSEVLAARKRQQQQQQQQQQRDGSSGSAEVGTATHSAAASSTFVFGADEFLPCFMLLVLRAKPYHYYQNVRYIDRYRTPTLRSPEESYCLTVMLSAAEFWLHCDDRGQLPPRTSHTTTTTATATDNGSDHARVAHAHDNDHGSNDDDDEDDDDNDMPSVEVVEACSNSNRYGNNDNNNDSSQARNNHTSKKHSDSHRSNASATHATGVVVPAPPALREQDLLPSVRRASMANRAMAAAQQTATSVMDVLFGSHASKPLPLASNAHTATTATAATASNSGSSRSSGGGVVADNDDDNNNNNSEQQQQTTTTNTMTASNTEDDNNSSSHFVTAASRSRAGSLSSATQPLMLPPPERHATTSPTAAVAAASTSAADDGDAAAVAHEAKDAATSPRHSTAATTTAATATNAASSGGGGYTFDLLNLFGYSGGGGGAGAGRPSRRAMVTVTAPSAQKATTTTSTTTTTTATATIDALLVRERRSFDELTVTQLRAIVEEARRLRS